MSTIILSSRTVFKSVFILFFGFISFASSLYSNSPKAITAVRITENIRIDGKMDEQEWVGVPVADDFIQFDPDPGKTASHRSEVRILYDNSAIYIGAHLFDDEPGSILKELSERDQIGNADNFSVIIDTYNNGLNGFGFVLTASGVQSDILMTENGEDNNWNAVWESAVSFPGDGWMLEIKIPYSAIRFPNKDIQNWTIQFGREIRRYRERSFWNKVDPTITSLLAQSGSLKGIENIVSPVRFSLTPFVSVYANNLYDPDSETEKSNTTGAYNAGMDLKYGLNDAFTLDMTLIPDFGQTIADNRVLNLSPFEVFFEENRQFFTESIELFSKGNFFYSRRIGGRPLHYGKVSSSLQEGESIIDNPITSQLYNATKISGRNSRGTGMGFFNAVVGEEYATIGKADGSERRIMTNPLTNYNVLVVDQGLKNNSSVSFTNTNVFRRGSDYEANVTGLTFNLRTKDQQYAVSGRAGLSQKYFSDYTDLGQAVYLAIGKIGGNWNTGFEYAYESADYDPNDLGFLFSPNENSFEYNIGYNQFAAKGNINLYRINMEVDYARLATPNVFTRLDIDYGAFLMFKTRFAVGMNASLQPIESYDYFEPRTADFSRYHTIPSNWSAGAFMSSDYRKTFALDAGFFFRKFNESGRKNYGFEFEPRLRLNDKLSLFFKFEYTKNDLSPGYVNNYSDTFPIEGLEPSDILFGVRNRNIIENALSGSYIFNNKMALTLRVRHYWDKVNYTYFGVLDEEGYLDRIAFDGRDETGENLYDNNVNFFNVDMQFSWRFAPGSDIFIVWKNDIANSDDRFDDNYFDNFTSLFKGSQFNSLSVRAVYYLDYLYLKK